MYKQEKKYYQKSFFIALIMAAALFLPFAAIDGGFFVFYGDYNAQQIPFFKMCVQAVHDGTLGWDWHTDLGANFVGSYTYYTLGSPFFWFMTLFPASWSPYLMAPLLCVKFGLISLFSFVYIRRFVTKPQTALIGGLLFAFSGFNLYNVFFQFQDAYIWFPLLLVGLEEAVVNKRRGIFALAVALNALANYFFFIQEVVFLIIYFLCRFGMDKRFDLNLKDFLCLAFESVVGVMIAGILFIPSIYQVLDVPRAHNTLTDWNFLFYGKEQRYGLILEGIFLPPEVSARNNMFNLADGKWSSVALYLPLFSMAGVVAFIKGAKGHWARVVMVICLGMSLIPGLNAAFTMFNNNFYTRWWYMPELICCLATAYTLEHEELDLRFGMKFCAVVTLLMGTLSTLAPFTKTIKDKATGESKTELVPRFLTDDKDGKLNPAVWVSLAIAVGFLVVLFFVIKMRGKLPKKAFTRRLTGIVMVCSMVLGYYFIGYGRIIGPNLYSYNKSMNAEFTINDPDFYRIEGLNEINNVNMLWGMSSLKSFTSIVPGSTFEMYELLGEPRSVNSAPKTDRYALRALTRVKYIMVPKSMNENTRKNDILKLSIYDYMETQGDYDIYTTKYALPMGFAYDSYYTVDEAKGNIKVDNLMVRAAILTDEQVEKFSDILTHEDPDFAGVVNQTQFEKDAMARIAEGVSQFSVNTEGFTAVSSYDTEKLVMFTVPFCKGWSAKINGEPAEVEKIDGGFCAVRVPAGVCDIVFKYRTPGLTLGIILSIAGVVLLCAYMYYLVKVKGDRAKPYVHLYPYDQVDGVKAHSTYIRQLSEQIYNCPERAGDETSELVFPEASEDFVSMEKMDFSARKPRERNSRITEDDEAYRVMEELDLQKKQEHETEQPENESNESQEGNDN